MKIIQFSIIVLVLFNFIGRVQALEPIDMSTSQFIHKCSRLKQIPPETKDMYSIGDVSMIWVWSMQAGICTGYWRAVGETQDYLTNDVCPPLDQHPNEQLFQGLIEEFTDYMNESNNNHQLSAQVAIMEFRKRKWPCAINDK